MGKLHLLSKTNAWVTTKIGMSDFEAEVEVPLPKEEGESCESREIHDFFELDEDSILLKGRRICFFYEFD